MRHPVSIVLAVLLVLSLPVSAVGTAGTAGSATAVQDSADESTYQFQSPTVSVRGDHAQLDGTPNRLVLGSDRETTHATPTPDFGLTVASQDDSIHIDYRNYAFERSFEELENDTRRSEAIIAELERIEDHMETLREREQEVVAAHAAGEASEEEVLRTVARNYYEARELERVLDQLRAKAPSETEVFKEALAEYHGREVGEVDLTDTNRDFTAELAVYTSPIRTAIASTLRGDEPERSFQTVAVDSARNGLVLAAIDGDEYIREATRYDNRDLNQLDQVESMSRAQDIAEELYPWAFDTTSGISNTNHDLVKMYTVQATSHDQGQLTAYVDGGTGSIYHERQTLELDSVPIETTDSMANRNATATLGRTPGIAPAAITVTNTNSDIPIDATILVDGTVVGETGEDGELWFVPPTDGFDLTVQTESESLNATVAASR